MGRSTFALGARAKGGEAAIAHPEVGAHGLGVSQAGVGEFEPLTRGARSGTGQAAKPGPSGAGAPPRRVPTRSGGGPTGKRDSAVKMLQPRCARALAGPGLVG